LNNHAAELLVPDFTKYCHYWIQFVLRVLATETELGVEGIGKGVPGDGYDVEAKGGLTYTEGGAGG
jgi:hypothetical protein